MGGISMDGYDISMYITVLCNSMGGISVDGYDISMCISMDMMYPIQYECISSFEVYSGFEV